MHDQKLSVTISRFSGTNRDFHFENQIRLSYPHRGDVSVDESGDRRRRLEVVEVVPDVDGPVLREEREEERGQEPTLADVLVLVFGLFTFHGHESVAVKGWYPNLGCHIFRPHPFN